MKYAEMLKKSFETMKNAYAPYSNFKVGACVKTTDGKIFCGANVENASYGLTNCAERSAIFQVYSQGYRKNDIEMIVIIADSENIISPCGACRQVLVELLNQDTPIILSNKNFQIIETNIKNLMPLSFTSEFLK